MDNVNLPGLSPLSVLRWQTELENSIQKLEVQITQLQKERAAALDDLAIIKNALLQSGHTSLDITQPALPAPTQATPAIATVPAAVAEAQPMKRKYNKREPVEKTDKPAKDKKKNEITANSKHDPKWSTNTKIQWALLNNKKTLHLKEIDSILKALEPNNKKLKDIATIISQNLDTIYRRIASNDARNPIIKLIK